MNVSPSPIKICKGMKLGEVIAMQSVQLVECDNVKASDEEFSMPDFNLDASALSSTEKLIY